MYQTDPQSSLICLSGKVRTSLPHTPVVLQVRLNIGTVGYGHKPAKSEIAEIVADLASLAAQRFVTLTELMQLVACEGRPFTPALLATPRQDGKLSKCNECFTSQQVFALDFDNSGEEIISLDNTLQRAAELDLVPFGAYLTPSSTPERPKYRVLFCMERPAANERDRQIVMRMLLELFPAADLKCKEASRHFNGVKSGPVEDPRIDPVAINSIAAVALSWQADIAQDKANCSVKIKRFASRYGLKLNSRRLALVDDSAPRFNMKCNDLMDTSTIYNIELATNSLLSGSPENPSSTSDLEGGGGYAGDFFWFDVSLEDYLAGKVPPIVKKTDGNRNEQHKTKSQERAERWDRIQDQLLRCPLMQTLFQNPDPDQPLGHDEFFHLATHFNNIRGADAIFEAALNQTEHNAERRIRQYRYMPPSYQPQQCWNSTCRHKDSCPYIQMPNHKNIFSLKFVRGQVRQISRTETISIDEARALMPEYFDQAVRSNKRISVIRADCGAGKTCNMIPVMLDEARAGNKVIYAAPTHRLLKETYDNLLAATVDDVKIYRWPDLVQYIEIDAPELAGEIKHLWTTSHHGGAATKIWNWAHGQARTNGYYLLEAANLSEEARDIRDYLEAKAHQNDSGPALWLMTHARLTYAPVKADICFIDEDILMRSLLTIRQCRYSNFNSLLTGLRDFSCNQKLSVKEREQAQNAAETINKLMQTIWQAGKNLVTLMPAIDFPSATLLTKVLPKPARFGSDTEEPEGEESNLLEFLTSRTVAFVRPGSKEELGRDAVVYVSRRNLPGEIGKFVIASASANPRLYEAFAGADFIDFISMPPIEHQGELVLHPEKSFAKASLGATVKAKTLQSVVRILDEQPDAGLICSKAMKSSLPPGKQQRVICTFGATEGLNGYQGQNLLVIGALHRPDYVYKLLAVALGQKLGLDTTLELEYQRISRNGYEYHAVAFDNKLLQEIQFAMIETDLEQAVGRARLVSHDCSVHLYTNIPLLQCRIAS